MSIQGIIIIICVAAAILFMAKKVYRSFTRKGCCNCDSADTCKSRNCYGGGSCPEGKALEELKPKR